MIARPYFTTPAASCARPRPQGSPRSGKALFLAAAAMMCAWTVYAAPQVRRPALAALQPLLGVVLPAEPPFRFGEVRARRMQIDGQTVLYVEGALTNTGKRPRKTPPLRVTLLGDDDQPLYTWKSKPAKGEMEPAREVSFQTRLLSPPEKFKSIAITLANEG